MAYFWLVEQLKLKAVGNLAVPTQLPWQLIWGAYCNELVTECTITLSQLGQLQLDAIFFTNSSVC